MVIRFGGCCGGITNSAAICIMIAFWLWLSCASADATSGDNVDPPSVLSTGGMDPPIVLPTGGTVMVAMV